MVCTRYISGVETDTDLTGRFEGKTAFLVGGSPTLLLQDYKRLSDRNVLSFGINNVGKTVRCMGYFFGDHPMCFFPSVINDRTALRFFNRGYEKHFKSVSGKIDDENLYFFTRINGDPKAATVYGKDITATNNTLCMAIAALLSFKVERIVLCGSSFDAGAYSYGKVLDEKERNWNSRLYTNQPDMLRRLAPVFGELGVEFIDTSVVSKVADTYPTMCLSDAIDRYADRYSDRQTTVPHCREAKVSSGGKVDEKISSEFKTFRHYDTPVFTGIRLHGDAEEKSIRALMFLVTMRSLAESNPGRKVFVFVDSGTVGDGLFRTVAGYALYWHKDTLQMLEVTPDIRRDVFGSDDTFMDNFRAYLPLTRTEDEEGIWLDCGSLVRQDLSFFVSDSRSLMPRNGGLSGAAVRGKPGTVDPGLLHMDFAAMRDTGLARKGLECLVSQPENDHDAYRRALDGLNPVRLDHRWCVACSALDSADFTGRAREDALSSCVLRFDIDLKRLPFDRNPVSSMLFRLLHGMRAELSQDALDALLAFDAEGKWKTRIDKGE